MELQRAQRNLKFLQNGDSINVTDHINLNGESEKSCSLNIETQVPEAQFSLSSDAVSYTHLDVYKRQILALLRLPLESLSLNAYLNC